MSPYYDADYFRNFSPGAALVRTAQGHRVHPHPLHGGVVVTSLFSLASLIERPLLTKLASGRMHLVLGPRTLPSSALNCPSPSRLLLDSLWEKAHLPVVDHHLPDGSAQTSVHILPYQRDYGTFAQLFSSLPCGNAIWCTQQLYPKDGFLLTDASM